MEVLELFPAARITPTAVDRLSLNIFLNNDAKSKTNYQLGEIGRFPMTDDHYIQGDFNHFLVVSFCLDNPEALPASFLSI